MSANTAQRIGQPPLIISAGEDGGTWVVEEYDSSLGEYIEHPQNPDMDELDMETSGFLLFDEAIEFASRIQARTGAEMQAFDDGGRRIDVPQQAVKPETRQQTSQETTPETYTAALPTP